MPSVLIFFKHVLYSSRLIRKFPLLPSSRQRGKKKQETNPQQTMKMNSKYVFLSVQEQLCIILGYEGLGEVRACARG